jgi:integrase
MSKKGFTSITHVIHHINRIRKKEGLFPVPNPSAQTFDLCSMDTGIEEIQNAILSAVEIWKRSFPLLANFTTLQYETGARVSEILQIHSSHITEKGRINLTTLKKGNTRILEPISNREWIISERSKGRYLFHDLNRFQVHRKYVEFGIAAYFGNNVKRSTTHIFRHLVGMDLSTLANPNHSIRIALGQKTEQAAEFYKTAIRGKDDN